MYSLKDYNYYLPDELIAQVPASPRDKSRLMVLERKRQMVSHYQFVDIARILSHGDLLVVNNTSVVPARLTGTKETGGRVEILLLSYPGQTLESQGAGRFTCECLVKTSKRPRTGSMFHFDEGLKAVVLGGADGIFNLEFCFEGGFETVLNKIGRIPLPPYIKRDEDDIGPSPCDDRVCYQTVYAEKNGAVAAPTAGLHFSNRLLNELSEKGVEIVPITLHVGYGTFQPVRVSDVRQHRIHPEFYEFTQEAASIINKAKDEKRRIIAVGTTVVRVLEFASEPGGRVKAGSGECDLFIYPGFEFKVIDALITNFHLPETTLLMLVSAFAGRDFIMNAYQEAVGRKYRFYSYGDAMFIL